VIGAVEELAQSNRTISLVDEIFEINFFANVNIIKAVLPIMRERKNGHIIVITGISELFHTNSCTLYANLQQPAT
jgi:short-subunit dehydrogenase